MHDYPLIGLHGKARSGKDTVASFILAARGGYIYSFADPIRAMLLPLGVDMRDPYWLARKEEDIPAINASPRRLMQTLGTEWGRSLIHPELWLTLATQRLINAGPGMIVSDVRFENEAEWVRSKRGRIIHIERPDAQAVAEHASEAGVERRPEDIYILNNESLDDLQQKVRRMFDGS